MVIKCVVCQSRVAEVPWDEVLEFIRWLDRTGELPICFQCADRAITNLYVQHGSGMSEWERKQTDLSFRPDRDVEGKKPG